MMFDPTHPSTRLLIDNFKTNRLSDPYRAATYRGCVEHPQRAFEAWVEQIGDAELYEQAYREGQQLAAQDLTGDGLVKYLHGLDDAAINRLEGRSG